ncbi:MAG: DUF3536 domain-containing protein [Candidatus Methylomirabilales bacterium]
MPVHLVIHGHFYQPPRENPWTGAIERQPSAAPFPNWNLRIAAECYEPNARSRVLDARGHIRAIVNNYARLSWNFGPTLLSWLAEAAPDVLAALRQADAESLARLGHGNAIAQAYNHMILPLASPRDRQTQIRWGIREFQHRFGRQPEAMWLAETAVDRLTLELLARAGMRYVILSPAQAARWRPLPDGPWTGAASGELDPRRPYRWVLRDARGAPEGHLGLDVCFYHAPLSRGVSFQHYLKDAGLLAARIQEAGAGLPDPLILIATDGESFGHHERFGDMCLATLFAGEADRRGIHVTNLGAYLADHRPAWEVELLPESAWSCSHGVGRWKEDCGCSAGGGPGWTQAWRGPLRRGLDRLRDALAQLFEDEAGGLLRAPWEARDDYIELLLRPEAEARAAFFATHQARPLGAEEQARALRLLEMQHQAMLMYTSCGWFFSDVGGIETVQNLRYAARAIELAAPFARRDLEAVLLEELARVQSNAGSRPTGRQIWEREVRPSRMGVEHAVARLLVEGLLGRDLAPQSRYRWRLTAEAAVREPDMALADVRAVSEVTGEAVRLAGAIRRDGPFDFVAGVAASPRVGWSAFAAEARRALAAADPGAWVGRYGVQLLRLRDFLPDERHALLMALTAEVQADLAAAAEALGKRSQALAEAMAGVKMPLPQWIAALQQAGLSRQFADTLAALGETAAPAAYAALLRLADLARHLGLTLDLTAASACFGQRLVARAEALAAGGDANGWRDLLELLRLGARLGLALPERALQDRVFAVLQARVPALLAGLRDARDPAYPLLTALLAVATRLKLRTEEIQERLRPLEESFARDPAYWP